MTAAMSLLSVVLGLLSVAIVFTFIRIVIGPTLADRVVALDILTAVGIGFTVVIAMLTGQALFIDVALLLALLAFIGTVAFAYYLDKGHSE